MKTEHELKKEMVEEMMNDITNVTAYTYLSCSALEEVCDELLRKGWRKIQ